MGSSLIQWQSVPWYWMGTHSAMGGLGYRLWNILQYILHGWAERGKMGLEIRFSWSTRFEFDILWFFNHTGLIISLCLAKTIILALAILLQVHKRVTYLRHLIVSLAQAQDISKVLLIFSHDFYHDEINDLVQSVDFCKVMQIYYPYSIQTHTKEFPGEDPQDCDRNMKKEQ